MKKEQAANAGKVVISHNAEKLMVLKHYASQSDININQVLTETMGRLFMRYVQQSVQAYWKSRGRSRRAIREADICAG